MIATMAENEKAREEEMRQMKEELTNLIKSKAGNDQ